MEALWLKEMDDGLFTLILFIVIRRSKLSRKNKGDEALHRFETKGGRRRKSVKNINKRTKRERGLFFHNNDNHKQSQPHT